MHKGRDAPGPSSGVHWPRDTVTEALCPRLRGRKAGKHPFTVSLRGFSEPVPRTTCVKTFLQVKYKDWKDLWPTPAMLRCKC